MITEIGIVAGDIWHFLDEHGETTLSALMKGIGKPEDNILMSLGWLAREGHVILQKINGDYKVALRKEEGRKGIALLIVLTTILVVVILGNVVLRLVLNQSRLTHHQTSRIQAYYASMAGVNLAWDRLIAGNDAAWPVPTAVNPTTKYISRTASCTAPCANPIVDPDLPNAIRWVRVVIRTPDSSGCTTPPPACCPPTGIPFCIQATTDYTYTP